jgi:predicted dehydrogenase
MSSRTPGTAAALAREFDVRDAFEDHRAMLNAVRPDIVHLNTPPTARLELLEACRDADVRGVIVEKPIAVDGADYLQLVEFARMTAMKVIVNHQLEFHPRRRELARIVTDGGIGAPALIDASAGDTMAYQGTHTLQAMMSFAADDVVRVFANASGATGLRPNVAGHYAPDACVAQVDFASGASGLFRCGANAPRVAAPQATERFHHKRIAVFGESGRVAWSMWGWESCVGGALASGEHDYHAEDDHGQAAMVDALCEWLDDERGEHPLALPRALHEFEVQLAIYTSALDGRVVSLPFTPRPALVDELRQRLAPPSQSGDHS